MFSLFLSSFSIYETRDPNIPYDIQILINKTSPDSSKAAISSINSSFLNEGDSVETEEFSKLFETSNFKEGVEAFLEKRRPNFNK